MPDIQAGGAPLLQVHTHRGTCTLETVEPYPPTKGMCVGDCSCLETFHSVQQFQRALTEAGEWGGEGGKHFDPSWR